MLFRLYVDFDESNVEEVRRGGLSESGRERYLIKVESDSCEEECCDTIVMYPWSYIKRVENCNIGL